jgi:hypothetical protein
MFEQKRRHKRIPIAAATMLRFRDKEHGAPLETMVGSISISGVGLYTDKHVEKDSDILLEIKFISVDGNMYHESIGGKIVYVNDIAGINYIGVEFDELINPAGQPHLYKHLFTVMKSSVDEP